MVFRYKHGDRPLDGYTIQRGVGAGGFGEVYFAVSDGGRQVALKCLQQNPEIELRGVGQCMNLKSPYLVTIFDVKTAPDGSSFVIMEYVTGPSLRDLLREAPSGLGPEKTAFFTREISKGLSFLHERGIVHRDLKPENIFFEDGCVKIGDYGLSKYISVSRQSCQTISVGTVHYMAPEIGSGRYHRGIDIYALGIMVFEMLTGRVPFTGDSFGEILMKHLTVEPDLNGIAAPFAPVVKKALAKNPDQRYGRVEDLTGEFLASPQARAWLDAFRPETFQAAAGSPAPAPETVVLGARGPAGAPASPPRPGAGAPPVPQPPAVPPPPQATGAPAPAPVYASDPTEFPRFQVRDLFTPQARQRHLFSLITACSMAVAVTLIGGKDISAFLGTLVVILSGAAAALLIEREAPGKVLLEPGLPRRLLTLCLAAPFYLMGTSLFSNGKLNFFALLLSTALVNWGERTKLQRLERISINQAFAAGIFAILMVFALNIFARGNAEWFLVGGCLAAISLCVNVSSPFHPRNGSARRSPPAEARRRESARDHAPPPPNQYVQSFSAGGYVQAEPYGPRPLPVRTAEPMGAFAKVFWWGSSAVFLATSLSLLFLTIFALGAKEEVCLGSAFSIATFGYFVFCTRVAWCEYWPGFLRTARWFFLTTFLNSAAVSALCMMVLGLRDTTPMAIFTLIFPLVFALFLALLPARKLQRAAELPGPAPPSPNPGWSTLGALLVTMGILVSLGSAVYFSRTTRAQEAYLQARSAMSNALGSSIPVEAPVVVRVAAFAGSPLPLLAGLALFLPGLFCVLRSRQGQGAAHVLRGASGFLALGALVYLTSDLLHELASHRVEPGPMPFFVLFGTGVLAAVFLFWPARALPASVK